jgi:hypothetical protein
MEMQLEDGLITYDEKWDSFDIVVRSNKSYTVTQNISYCPWCASVLPVTQRDRWFDELEARGIDPMKDKDAVPDIFLTSAWREK